MIANNFHSRENNNLRLHVDERYIKPNIWAKSGKQSI